MRVDFASIFFLMFVMQGCSPVPAVKNLLKKVGRKSVSEYVTSVQLSPIFHFIGSTTHAFLPLRYDRIEINEAFASQYLACERELGLVREKTNVNGSGIGACNVASYCSR